MFGRRLEKLIVTQHEEVMARHEETMAYLRQREVEMREEFQQRRVESKRRDEESEQRMEESERCTEETREFNREILLRNEKVYKAVIAEVEEGRKQIQANTRAVLSVLDRLKGSGGIAA